MSTFVHMSLVYVFVLNVSAFIVPWMTLLIKFVAPGMVSVVLPWSLLIRILIRKPNCSFSMCMHGKFVTNRYTGKTFWSTCGKCKACLQEKAARRSNRIRNEYDGVTPIYFVTLTYDRLSVPYFTQEDFDKINSLPVGNKFGLLPIRRKKTVKWSLNKRKYVSTYKSDVICNVPVSLDEFNKRDLRFRWLNKSRGDIGICYFKDLQDFKKRLNINLKRNGYDQKFKVFDCSEYGGKSLRPHFHLLVSIKGISEEAFHGIVSKSWPFGRRIRNAESCQLVTKDPAGYVSSYVNSGENLSPFFTRYFASRHSTSKFYGHGLRSFSLEEITKKVSTGTLNYYATRIRLGIPEVFDFPMPKYVVNRWFPLFKGYSRFTSDTVYKFLSSGFNVEYLRRKSVDYDLNNPKTKIDYRPEIYRNDLNCKVPSDLHKILIRFIHAFQDYKKVFPDRNYCDYALDYLSTWSCWKNTCYKYFRLDSSVPEFYKFDNVCFMKPDKQKEFYVSCPDHDIPFIVDNNNKPPTVARTLKMVQMYDKYCKQKEVTGFCLNEIGVDV